MYEESALTGQGRVPDRNFRAIADVAAARRTIRAARSRERRPGRLAVRADAVCLRRVLSRVSGRALRRSVAAAVDGRDGGPHPVSSARGRSRRSSNARSAICGASSRPKRARRCAGAGATVTRLTEHGFTVGGPRFGPDGTLYYSVVNPHGFPALLARGAWRGGRAQGGGPVPRRAHRVRRRRDRLRSDGDRAPGRAAVGPLRRSTPPAASHGGLTHGARAGDPDVSPDGRVIVCTIQRADRRELATLRLPAARPARARPFRSRPSPASISAAPRWSPDGRSIAAERVSLAGRSEIVLVDPASGRVVRTVASSHGSRSVSPAWLPDGRLLFASDRGGDGFRIFVTDVDAAPDVRASRTPARTPPRPSPRAMAARSCTSATRLMATTCFRCRSSRRDGRRRLDTIGRGASRERCETPARAARAGDARRERLLALAHHRAAILDADARVRRRRVRRRRGHGRRPMRSGDTPTRVEAGWSTARGAAGLAGGVRLRPLAPDALRERCRRHRPLARRRSAHARGQRRRAVPGPPRPLVAVAARRAALVGRRAPCSDWRVTAGACGSGDAVRMARRALRGGWLLNDSRSYGYSISREDGWTATVTTELTREALGADGDGEAATARCARLPSRRGRGTRVLAARARRRRGMGRSASPPDVQRVGQWSASAGVRLRLRRRRPAARPGRGRDRRRRARRSSTSTTGFRSTRIDRGARDPARLRARGARRGVRRRRPRLGRVASTRPTSPSRSAPSSRSTPSSATSCP